ncbi:hypothetical protein HRI_002243400 [Hibiscus trionum]|uniref:RNase H type-1 domain-containing protein n=1 Tax=Hibiscus trionum TaxID=183268 RepID=A0A9W7HYL3_HIBTR|nr:hypothetical protein HRI_002243400 [Hibiscus trionum]
MAILEALSIVIKSKWAKVFCFELESDCNNVVLWLRNPFCSPLAFRPIVDACLRFGASLNWRINSIGRDCNQAADSLAKSGINRHLDYVIVAD